MGDRFSQSLDQAISFFVATVLGSITAALGVAATAPTPEQRDAAYTWASGLIPI